ncbi:ABC transporter permease family protein [Halomicrobium zhouii]|nr:hypothetical protein [Halomicrobium zhouii]
MDRPDPSSFVVSILRGVGVAAWTWVAFAAVSATILVRVDDEMQAALDGAVSSSFVESFLGVLTFDFGLSILYQEPAIDIVSTALPTTLLLLGQVAVVAAVLGGALVALSRNGPGARRLVEVFGYLGAFPVPVVLFGCYALGTSTGWAWLSPGAGGSLGNWLEATALALPIAAVTGRVVVREPRNRGWLIDAWLFGMWILGTVVFVERAAEIPGLGYFYMDANRAFDVPLTFAIGAALVLLGLVGVVARELAVSAGSSDRFGSADAGPGPAVPDGGTGVSDLDTVLRDDRRVQAGLAGFGVFLAIGVVGSVLLDPVPVGQIPQSPIRATVEALGVVTFAAVGVATVASVLGVAFGLLSARVRYGRAATALTVGLAANVSFFVWMQFARAAIDLPLPDSVWLGVAVTPPVALVARRKLAGRAGIPVAALWRPLGVAVTGAAVAALVVVQIQLVGSASGHVLEPPTGVAVGLPVLSLFLLGEGLRRR